MEESNQNKTATASKESLPLEVFCDEAGFTGPNLLDRNQPTFAYSSVAVPNIEAWEILQEARSLFPVQMPELKSSNLSKSKNGRDLMLHVLKKIRSRYSVIIFDKALSLGAKIFEYIYEPVFKDNPTLVYKKDLHRFVAMYCYTFFIALENKHGGQNDSSYKAIREFEIYMRTLDPGKAPTLFGGSSPNDSQNPFNCILDFANGYRDLIVPDNDEIRYLMPDKGKWILDISIAAVWSLCNFWGQEQRPLKLICDNSKPILALSEILDGSENGAAIRRCRALFGREHELGFEFSEPVNFEDSRGNPSLQIADIVAGCAIFTRNSEDRKNFELIGKEISEHLHIHTIFPDLDLVNLENRTGAINWLVLIELARRAQNRSEPYLDLETVYKIAEDLFDSGQYRLMINFNKP